MINGKNIIVSFTTYPARIAFAAQVVRNILSQSVSPDRIILYLSKDQFPSERSGLPQELLALEADEVSFEICFVEGDLKPHKKYFYALQQFPEDLVITVDDDLVYGEDMIEKLLAAYEKHTRALIATRVHLMTYEGDRLLPYSNWLHEADIIIDEPSIQLLATTGAGTLFPPHVFDERLFDKKAILENCLRQDDLWIKANAMRLGIPVVLAAPNQRLNYIKDSQVESLYSSNEAGENDSTIAKVDNYFKEKYGGKVFDRPQSGYIDLSQICTYAEGRQNEIRRLNKLEGELRAKLQDGWDARVRLNNELNSVYASKAYKVGNALAKPLRHLRDKK